MQTLYTKINPCYDALENNKRAAKTQHGYKEQGIDTQREREGVGVGWGGVILLSLIHI